MMVAEMKTILHCNPEDRDIVADSGAHVVYMLSLAVSHAYRRLGLASRLLRHLLDSVVDNSPYPKAVFLHVLSTNLPAIRFYKSHGFVHHTTLL
ncbi:acetyltransferase, GNAT family, partial [Ostertagia ostertagi]